MSKKAKDKSKKNSKKKPIDEYELRRNLRDQTKMSAFEKEAAVSAPTRRSPEDARIGGIEGGATQSLLLIIDGNGKKLFELKGPSTNHWFSGMEETAARISAMIQKGKEELDIPSNVPLDCVGLCLSGCEEEQTNRKLRNVLLEKHPQAARDYLVESDTVGSVKTAFRNGGIVLIAGTGSSAVLVNPDGTTHNCGGWGYMMGDEGSGYSIAHRACKYVFDDMDNFIKSPYPTSYVWSAMRNFFHVTDRRGILPHLYTNFDKSTFAGFAIEIVGGCERGDALCLAVFEECGELLARHIVAVAKNASNDLKLAKGGLQIMCIGSVFKSWKFLEKGFVREINETSDIEEFSLSRLIESSALGACYIAAEHSNYPFEKSYENNAKLFFHYKRENYPQIKNKNY